MAHTVSISDLDIVFGEYQPGGSTPHQLAQLDSQRVLGALAQVEAYATQLGITIRPDLSEIRAFGAYTFATREARLAPGLSPLLRLHTLLQIIAHAKLHHRFYSRQLGGLEAEACALTVCELLGIDASPEALGYTPGWTHDSDVAARTKSRGRQAAQEIYADLFPTLTPQPPR